MKKPLRFILLDDEVTSLTLAAQVIKNYNRRAEIIIFLTAEEALAFLEKDDMLNKDRDTVLLTDLHMPQMDGFALLRHIENRFQHLREKLHIFVLSGGASAVEIQQLKSYRCLTGSCDKPF